MSFPLTTLLELRRRDEEQAARAVADLTQARATAEGELGRRREMADDLRRRLTRRSEASDAFAAQLEEGYALRLRGAEELARSALTRQRAAVEAALRAEQAARERLARLAADRQALERLLEERLAEERRVSDRRADDQASDLVAGRGPVR
jgi:hypothetical protein